MLNGKRRKTALWAGGGAAIALAAVSITLAALPSTATAAAGQAIPAAAVANLRTHMLRLSKASGDRHPTSITAVATTRARAMLDATPGDGPLKPARLGKPAVYLVVLKGNFTLNDVPTPAGSPAPRGKYLAVTVDPSTFRVLDIGLQNRPFPIALSRYGPVSDLIGH